MTEMREFTTIVTYYSRYERSITRTNLPLANPACWQVRRARDNLRYISERVTMGMNEVRIAIVSNFNSIAKVELSLSEFYLSVRNFISLFIYSSDGREPLYRYNNVKRRKAINSRVGRVIFRIRINTLPTDDRLIGFLSPMVTDR